jgi:glyoxylase I family protein
LFAGPSVCTLAHEDKGPSLLSVALHHIGLASNDPLAVERFYARYFGFRRARVISVGDGEQVVFLRSGDAYLELFQARGGAPAGPSTGAGPEYQGFRHLAFKVDDVDAKLREMGDDARITLGPVDFSAVIPGWKTVWVADPGGNIVEISQGFQDQLDPPTVPF